MTKPKQVSIDQSTLDFFSAECAQVHALCDHALVPRDLDGSGLSFTQRVAILHGAYIGLAGRVGMADLFPTIQ